MSDFDATTSVEVVMRGRIATIADLRQMLDVLTAERIPDTFEVEVQQYESRVPQKGVAYPDQRTEPVLKMSARRAARRVRDE